MKNVFDILIVEDEKVVNDTAGKILTSEGYSVDQAYDGQTALGKIESNAYRLVITDLMLKEISGFKIIELIIKKFSQMPVIMITGYATLANIFESFKTGAFDFIPKPFTYEELIDVVMNAFKFSKSGNKPGDALNHFAKNIPGGNPGRIFFVGNHAWACINDDKSIDIGLGSNFSSAVGEISGIEFPAEGDYMIQGNQLMELIYENKQKSRIWSPVSGKVTINNRNVLDNLDLFKTEKFITQWLIRIMPDDIEKEIQLLKPYIMY